MAESYFYDLNLTPKPIAKGIVISLWCYPERVEHLEGEA